MFHLLVNHNDDLKRLIEKGYAVTFDSNYLIVRDIPYLDSGLNLQFGAIVTKIVLINENKITQEDHQIFFAGSMPYNLNGKPIPNLGGGETQLALSENNKDIVVQRSFSNKPTITGSFQDFFEKVESYVTIISGPAIERHNATPYTFRAITDIPTDTVFKFHDTMTSRAEITDLSSKFKNDVVAVIGLGGTGAYVLDHLTKTPVREIIAFDLDPFHVHNSFRSPGKLEKEEFGKPKSDVYKSRYDNFRSGLTLKNKYIDETSDEDLKDVTFAFVCVDKGSSRSKIFDILIAKGIPFIDVGMGINRRDGKLNGLIRTTYYSAEESKKLRDRRLAELKDDPNDEYRTNIQIGELNALNACLAVIKFKQLRGFYYEEIPYYNMLFEIGDSKIVGESIIDED